MCRGRCTCLLLFCSLILSPSLELHFTKNDRCDYFESILVTSNTKINIFLFLNARHIVNKICLHFIHNTSCLQVQYVLFLPASTLPPINIIENERARQQHKGLRPCPPPQRTRVAGGGHQSLHRTTRRTSTQSHQFRRHWHVTLSQLCLRPGLCRTGRTGSRILHSGRGYSQGLFLRYQWDHLLLWTNRLRKDLHLCGAGTQWRKTRITP